MIAKEIPKRSNKQQASIKRLVDYITRAKSDKPLSANISNCGVDQLNAAVRVITATQEMARKGHDKSYHLILSFHPGDDLAPIVSRTLKKNAVRHWDLPNISEFLCCIETLSIHIFI